MKKSRLNLRDYKVLEPSTRDQFADVFNVYGLLLYFLLTKVVLNSLSVLLTGSIHSRTQHHVAKNSRQQLQAEEKHRLL